MRRSKRFVPLARFASALARAPELDALPARIYGRPAAMLRDPSLSLAEKRAVLASWASDACAVDSAPTLRRPSTLREPVSFEEIMDALRSLDRMAQGGGLTADATKTDAREIRPS